MEQVALPVEGPERQVVERLLTKDRKKARAAMPEAKVRALFADLGDQLPQLLQGLVARGLIETSQKNGKAMYALSPTAVAALRAANTKPRAARAARPKAITVEDVQVLLRDLEARLVERITAEVVNAVREAIGARPKSAQTAPKAEPLEAAIPGAIKEADRHGHHGGLVPIPEVRRLVQERTGATRAQFDAALLALERQFRVDLKIANDARRPDAAEGIEVPGRGLVYFALAR